MRVPADTGGFKGETDAAVTYDCHFVGIMQARTLKYGVIRSCLVSGEAGLYPLAKWWWWGSRPQ